MSVLGSAFFSNGQISFLNGRVTSPHLFLRMTHRGCQTALLCEKREREREFFCRWAFWVRRSILHRQTSFLNGPVTSPHLFYIIMTHRVGQTTLLWEKKNKNKKNLLSVLGSAFFLHGQTSILNGPVTSPHLFGTIMTHRIGQTTLLCSVWGDVSGSFCRGISHI